MADFDPKFLIKLTYHEFVFYSEKKNKFVVNRNLTELKDFMKVNTLRQYAADSDIFDKNLFEKIQLCPTEPEDHNNIKKLKPKLDLLKDLVNYADFF